MPVTTPFWLDAKLTQEIIVIKPVLSIIFCALIAAGCSSGDDNNSGGTTGGTTGGGTTGGGTTGGTTGGGGGTTGGGTTGGGTTGGGPIPSFGDSAQASNGLPATTTVCPTSVTASFTGWALSGGNWCAYKCPAGFENDDNDDWGFITSNQNACRATTAAAGATITATIFTPDSERIYVSDTANPSSGSPYSCASWQYNETTRIWENLGSQFSLTLSADNTAVDAGTSTTWSFSNGVITLESGRVLTNVAVGNNAFSSWQSNTALIRCVI